MEVILKNKDILSLTIIPDNEIELVKANNDEVITDFKLSEEDKQKVYKWCTLNSDMTITETQEYRDNLEQEKQVEIQSIETKLLKLSSEKKGSEELIAMWVGTELYTEKLETINKEMSELVGQLQQLIK